MRNANQTNKKQAIIDKNVRNKEMLAQRISLVNYFERSHYFQSFVSHFYSLLIQKSVIPIVITLSYQNQKI